MITELGNQEIKDNVLTRDLQEPRETTIAQGGKSTTDDFHRQDQPARETQRAWQIEDGRCCCHEDNNSKNEDNGDKEEDDGEMEEDEEPDDDSAIKYNKGLKNSSGYNEDL